MYHLSIFIVIDYGTSCVSSLFWLWLFIGKQAWLHQIFVLTLYLYFLLHGYIKVVSLGI